MKICSLLPFLSVLVGIVAMGCADHPVNEIDDNAAGAAFISAPQQIVAMAPQRDAEDKPSARLLALFPEFFPDGVKHTIPLREIFHGGPLKDGIPALTNPRTIDAGAADYLRDTDLVLGITINGQSRAYPLRILNWHEIANDTLGGKKIVVTYCPLCGTGIAFDPVVEGEPLEFGVSGMLYNNDLLMYDRKTDTPSLWVQALGEAVVGPRTGTLLHLLPLTQAQWGEWKATHPGTTVLSTATGYGRNYDFNPYAGYERDEGLLFPLSGKEDTRLNRKTKILGVRLGDTSKAYVMEELRQMQVVNDEVAGIPIVLIASPNADSVRVYERKTYQFDGSVERIMDINTNDIWVISEDLLFNPQTADSLERVPHVFTSFWFAWFSFYPDTLIYEGPVKVNPNARKLTTWGTIKR